VLSVPEGSAANKYANAPVTILYSKRSGTPAALSAYGRTAVSMRAPAPSQSAGPGAQELLNHANFLPFQSSPRVSLLAGL